MKRLILFSLVLLASSSFAQSVHYLSPVVGFFAPGENVMTGTWDDGTNGTRTFSNSGLFAIGVDYDYMLKNDTSLGGMLRYYNCSSTYNSTTFTDRMFLIGPDIRAYLNTTNWIAYIDSGFDMIFPSYTEGNRNLSISASVAWMIGIGALYKVSDSVSVGFETTRLIGLSSSANGSPLEDYMIKGRFALGR